MSSSETESRGPGGAPAHEQGTASSGPFDRSTPVGAARYFQHCVRSGDLDAAMDCFDPDSVYVTGPGAYVRGLEEIRTAVSAYVSVRPDLRAHRWAGLAAGDIVAWVDEWTIKATLPDGTVLDMSGVSSDVLRRRPDGTFIYLVDNPYGHQYLDA
ncbi:YybH family protein [Streptomyces toxytricini]|uniref:YybH family protein n=1 Tax=Streptomyces toxytricini TaxID=67369 RepID=UPI00342867CF